MWICSLLWSCSLSALCCFDVLCYHACPLFYHTSESLRGWWWVKCIVLYIHVWILIVRISRRNCQQWMNKILFFLRCFNFPITLTSLKYDVRHSYISLVTLRFVEFRLKRQFLVTGFKLYSLTFQKIYTLLRLALMVYPKFKLKRKLQSDFLVILFWPYGVTLPKWRILFRWNLYF